ncbi:hypothetical protein C3492_39905 [Streptomyces sp. Ru62]|nr:hypothetical protein C3492_39905 [Streptomyces sp. Ru62]
MLVADAVEVAADLHVEPELQARWTRLSKSGCMVGSPPMNCTFLTPIAATLEIRRLQSPLVMLPCPSAGPAFA